MLIKIFLLNYCTFCCLWVVVIATIQVIKRKNFMQNWAFINDAKGIEESRILADFPPVDGWPMTILCCFLPILNIGYGFLIATICFNDTESEIIQWFQYSARQIRGRGDDF